MAKDYTKSTSSGLKPAVRQFRGPGMNLGLKKPRRGYIPKPKDAAKSGGRSRGRSAQPASMPSYLPEFDFDGKGRR